MPIRSISEYDPTPALITVKEAAALSTVSEKWWRRRIADGTCPVLIYRIGKHIRFNRKEVDSWLECQHE